MRDARTPAGGRTIRRARPIVCDHIRGDSSRLAGFVRQPGTVRNVWIVRSRLRPPVHSLTMDHGWNITEVGAGSSPLVIHIPHSATWLPETERSDLLLGEVALEAELKNITDWYTDRIALDALNAKGLSGTVFVNNVSRLVVDPERFLDEAEPMEAIGMGAVYSTSGLRPLRHPDPVDRERLLDTYFSPYARAFTDLVDQRSPTSEKSWSLTSTPSPPYLCLTK